MEDFYSDFDDDGRESRAVEEYSLTTESRLRHQSKQKILFEQSLPIILRSRERDMSGIHLKSSLRPHVMPLMLMKIYGYMKNPKGRTISIGITMMENYGALVLKIN